MREQIIETVKNLSVADLIEVLTLAMLPLDTNKETLKQHALDDEDIAEIVLMY